MTYAYRWYYLLASILLPALAAYYCLLGPDLARINKLNAAVRDLSAVMMPAVKPPPDNALNFIRNPPVMSALASLLRLSGLELVSAQLAPWPASGGNLIHLAAQGSFQQAAAFLEMLERQGFPVKIRHFSCECVNPDKLTFAMDLLADKALLFRVLDKVPDTSTLLNPFCAAGIFTLSSSQAASLRSVSLYLLKMRGYLRRGSQTRAFIQLPDETTVLAGSGDRIGREGGQIGTIMHDQVKVVLPGKREFIIH